MNLLTLKQIYCIGIKGAGMTALAELLLRHGVAVSGSDTEEVFFTDDVLKRLGISVLTPFDAQHITGEPDVFIYSTAWTETNNVEMRAARETGKPMLAYPEALGLLTETKMTVAVSGTHGKTTTSALLAECLRIAGMDPSAVVGSAITSWGGGALAGKGKYLVVEADEYQDKFRFYHPLAIILTSVDWDHPDYFVSPEAYEAVFGRFVARLPRHGVLVANGDEARVNVVASQTTAKVITYGFLEGNDVRIIERVPIDPEQLAPGVAGFYQKFTVEHQGKILGPFSLRLSGRHNAANAAAVIALFLALKLPLDSLTGGLAGFRGTKRRFEYLGMLRGALVFDDYAHHPDEIRATLTAFRELYPKRRLIVVFHPHTFTRTKALFEDFAESLCLADSVYLIDIYGSAREVQGGVTSEDLVTRMNRVYPGKAEYVPNRHVLSQTLHKSLNAEDLVVTMGAGDVWLIAEAILKDT